MKLPAIMPPPDSDIECDYSVQCKHFHKMTSATTPLTTSRDVMDHVTM